MLSKMDRRNKWTIYISCKYHQGTYQVERRKPAIILHQWKLRILFWCLWLHFILIMCKLNLSSNCFYIILFFIFLFVNIIYSVCIWASLLVIKMLNKNKITKFPYILTVYDLNFHFVSYFCHIFNLDPKKRFSKKSWLYALLLSF